MPFTGLDFDPISGLIAGAVPAQKCLSALAGCWVDPDAYARLCAAGDPVVYHVTSAPDEPAVGGLGYGLGCVFPGRVGDEYFLTRGHLHRRREAAEVYIGLRGTGLMLLEDERMGECGVVALAAGHDYGFVGARNFRQVVVAVDGQPRVIDRATYSRP